MVLTMGTAPCSPSRRRGPTTTPPESTESTSLTAECKLSPTVLARKDMLPTSSTKENLSILRKSLTSLLLLPTSLPLLPTSLLPLPISLPLLPTSQLLLLTNQLLLTSLLSLHIGLPPCTTLLPATTLLPPTSPPGSTDSAW